MRPTRPSEKYVLVQVEFPEVLSDEMFAWWNKQREEQEYLELVLQYLYTNEHTCNYVTQVQLSAYYRCTGTCRTNTERRDYLFL